MTVEERLDELEKGRTENAHRIAYAIVRLRIFGLVFLLAFSFGLWRVQVQATNIQDSREDAVRQSCEDTNQRHDHTIAALNALLDKAIREHPEQRDRIEQSRTSTVLLINALTPKRDCETLVNQLAN